MPRKVRLLARAFIDNHLYEPGEIVTLKDGDRGPHRAVRNGVLKIDYDPANGLDANRIQDGTHDEPLFVEVKED
jgi:hypothetical protein